MKLSVIQGGHGLPSYALLCCCFSSFILCLLYFPKYTRDVIRVSRSFCDAARQEVVPFLEQKSLVLTSSVENTQDSFPVLFQALWPDLSALLWLYEVCQKETDTDFLKCRKNIFHLLCVCHCNRVRFCIRSDCTSLSLFSNVFFLPLFSWPFCRLRVLNSEGDIF